MQARIADKLSSHTSLFFLGVFLFYSCVHTLSYISNALHDALSHLVPNTVSAIHRYDYDTLAISRPELYNFLVDRIPEEKLVLGKQVQELVFQDIAHHGRSAAPAPAVSVSVPASNNRSIEIGRGTEVEMEDGVQLAERVGAERGGGAMTTTTLPLMDSNGSTPTTTSIAAVLCTDRSRYEGIIIGADGAYSTIRLSLYRHLREQGLLTTAAATADKGDVNEDRHHGPMRAQFRVLVGMTRELDPDRFELLKSEYSDVRVLVSNGVHPFEVSKEKRVDGNV